MKRLAPGLALLCLAALVAAAPASATVRHAAPGGATTGDCTAIACDFGTAIGVAAGGDEVVVAPGDYGSPSSPIGTTSTTQAGSFNSIDVHGVAGQPRPRVFGAPEAGGHVLSLSNGGATLRHLELYAVGTATNTVALSFHGSVAEDLLVKDSIPGSYGGCVLSGDAELRDAVCWTPSLATAAEGAIVADTSAGTSHVTLRNVTAAALGSEGTPALTGSPENHPLTLDAYNSVMTGTTAVKLQKFGTGTITFNPLYSDVFGAHDIAAGGCCTETPSATNLASNPRLVAPAAGDFHQSALSPTIDRGTDALSNGAADIDGQIRFREPHTDIGADELYPPSAATGAASGITRTAAKVAGVGNDRDVSGARLLVQYGATAKYGRTSAARQLPASNAGQARTLALTGLAAGTTYHYRVVLRGPAGNANGKDATFKTLGSPFRGLRLPAKQTVTVAARTAKVKATCPAAASGRCKGNLTLSRKANGKRVKLGKAPFSLKAGKTARLPVALNDGAVKRLDAARKIAARAAASTTDATGGKAHATSGKVVLERPATARARIAAAR